MFGFRITNDGEYKINWRNLSDSEIQLLKNFKPKTHDLEEDFENYINSLKDIEIESDHAIELFNYYKKCLYGTAFLDDLLKDENIEEISIIEDNFVYVYVKNKGWLKTNVFVEDGDFVYNLINHIAKNTNRRITLKNPRINASYKNIRIHGAIKPIAEKNSLTIRRFNKNIYKPKDLVNFKTLTPFEMAFLWCCMLSEINILIAGNTGSGKTTTLNVLANMINPKERIILVEETPEMSLRQKHVVRLISNQDLNISMKDLILDTLRMRPDRVFLGEIRSDEEVSAFIETLLSGQGKASYTTYHAQSTDECIKRLKKQGVEEYNLTALDLIIIQRRYTTQNGEFRKVFEIYSLKDKKHVKENRVPKNILEKLNIYFDGKALNEIKKRKEIVKECDDTYEFDKFEE